MSERKVLNKYYPPDFDPSKIPRMKLPKNRQYTVRLMAPFNMRCATCGEYIYKGKKFNARKEDVEDEDYLGIRIYRFYIKCTRCLQEISFRTDPRTTDYEIEAGAIRNFMALKKAEEQAKREEEEEKESEANNPMKLLENRTEQSKQEMELVEALEELRELNVRQGNVDFDAMLKRYNTEDRKILLQALQDKEDEKIVKQIFGTKKRVVEEVIEEENDFMEDVVNKKIKFEHEPDESDRITFAGSSNPPVSSSTITSAFRQNITSFIRKKDPATTISVPSNPSASFSDSKAMDKSSTTSSVPTGSTSLESSSSASSVPDKSEEKEESQALSLLGAYSSSEGSEEE